jgi:hypothetical protein
MQEGENMGIMTTLKKPTPESPGRPARRAVPVATPQGSGASLGPPGLGGMAPASWPWPGGVPRRAPA